MGILEDNVAVQHLLEMGIDSLSLLPEGLLEEKTAVDWLRSIYKMRREKNPAYSLRAFAQHLDMPSGRLSEILRGKRRLTLRMAEKIAERLYFSDDHRQAFFRCAAVDLGVKPAEKNYSDENYTAMAEEVTRLVGDWQHFGILNLMRTQNFEADCKWIAKRLGLTTVEVAGALDRLVRLGFVHKDGDSWQRTPKNLTSTHGIKSWALRRAHRMNLDKGIEALDGIPVHLRDISSITMPVNMKKIDQARVLIKNFRRSMAELLEDSEATEVYNLNIQLVPLTKVEKKP